MKKTGGQLLQSLFDVNHPFWQSVEKVFTIFLLNICFVVTSFACLDLWDCPPGSLCQFGHP